MSREPWLSEESRLGAAARQAFSRGLRRPVRTVGVALLVTGGLVAARALEPPSYEATLYFRLAEGDLTDPHAAPRPPRAIGEYLAGMALSRRRVEEVMRKYRWSSRRLARDPAAAVEEFREDVQVEATRNYFLYDRQPGDPPRSALVRMSLVGPDPEKTRAVLHEIGQDVVAEQRAQREAHLAQARRFLEAQLEMARARERSLRAAVGRLSAGTASAGPRAAAGRSAEIAALETRAEDAGERVVALERRLEAVEFTAGAEAERLGLDFDLFDESLVARTPPLGPLQLAGAGALAFAVVLVLVAAVAGAFDDRIYGAGDLEVRDLPLFGALPRFPGDEVGSYRARMSPGEARP